MPKYRVKPGRVFSVPGMDDYTPSGGVVELTTDQASGFMDLLVPLKRSEEAAIDEVKATIPVLAGYAELESMTVAELKALTEWAAVPEPKPTRKAEIVESILKVREAD